jgi:pimeloyl-ACP methyl ester carboxylesterase
MTLCYNELMEMTISGKLISYDVIGSGAPILFVHGWGSKAKTVWTTLVESLSASYQCYLIDLPGFGGSENPDSDWGVEEYADVIKKFILELNLTGLTYLGHSFGGALGVYLGANHSELFEGLILSSPSYRRPNASRNKKKRSHFLNIFRLRLLRRIKYKLLYPNSELMKLPHLESNFRKIVSTDLSDMARKIKLRTLIIWPSDDIETPLNDAYLLKSHIPSSILKVVGSQGHDMIYVTPSLVLNDIKDFLS